MMIKTKSIVTEYSGICFCCGRPATEEHHLLFGGSVRRLAEEDGIKVPCCLYCHTQNDVKNRIHDNPMAEKLSKIAGQLAWEKHAVAQGMTEAGAREVFRKRYNSSLL